MPRLAFSLRNNNPLLAAPRRQQQCSHGTRQFHASSVRRDSAEAQKDHYEALELPYTASAAEIKRQFYALSKRHHPDRNKGDPSSSSRFVRISEAYHVLGSPEKRTRYDRDLARSQNRSSAHHHHHHPASYAGPAGSRPPSGLSRRRTQFRGPPPSFYRNGAWGAHSAKRAAAGGFDGSATHSGFGAGGDAGDEAPGQSTSSSTGGDNTYAGAFYTAGGGGFGPGQAERGWDNHIPHWDRVAHRRTQEGIAARLARRARVRGESVEEMKNGGGPWSFMLNFVVVSGAIAIVASIPSLFNNKKEKVAVK
ncbi:Heat shock protein DnaJ [Botryosphaeria dothidea]|uniref:Heat shock protein DnaJ n=1 Tax=Botryosphaeria dothidea TaxID=55169 RepID=A0A8H4J7K3_9PEZI|nr:Heat shock protein DnaJ [Botryosphaeria dothidea]